MYQASRFLITFIIAMAIPLSSVGQTWSTNFGPPPAGQGLNDEGWALAVYESKLIVGGMFTEAGPISAAGVAAWDGAQWSALGSGISNSWVIDVAEYNDELVAVGQSGPYGFVKRWDGSSWSSITLPAPSRTLYAVCAHNGLLFVNPRQGLDCVPSASSLAWWDGSTWASVPLPFPNAIVDQMATYQGLLYIAGNKITSWGDCGLVVREGFLYSWDGTSFGGPGQVFDDEARCLHAHNDLLHIGGSWNGPSVPPGTQGGVGIWDGSAWVPFGRDFPQSAALESYHGRLVAVTLGVTSFDGTTEIPLPNGPLYGLDAEVFQGDLYVTGAFWEAGSTPSSYIAKWSEPITDVGDTPAASDGLRIDGAPNPFNPSVTLSMWLPAQGHVETTISNANGQIVRHLESGVRKAGSHELRWDGTADDGTRLASGVYFAKVVSGGQVATRKLVLLK